MKKEYKKVILFSCVRANRFGRVGFLCDGRRVNVAFTRAKRGLVVFGHPRTLRCDDTWRSWLNFVDEHSLVVTKRQVFFSSFKRRSSVV